MRHKIYSITQLIKYQECRQRNDGLHLHMRLVHQ